MASDPPRGHRPSLVSLESFEWRPPPKTKTMERESASLTAELSNALKAEMKKEEEKHRIDREDHSNADSSAPSSSSGDARPPNCVSRCLTRCAWCWRGALRRCRRHVVASALPAEAAALSVPALWLRVAAGAMIAMWIVALTAEAILADTPQYLLATQTSGSLFACLGAVTLVAASAVVLFTFQPTRNSLSCLALSSLLSMLVLLLLVFLAERSLNLVVDLEQLYREGLQILQQGTNTTASEPLVRLAAYDSALDSLLPKLSPSSSSSSSRLLPFPPSSWCWLETSRAAATFLAAMAAKALLGACVALRFTLLFHLPKDSPLDVDTDDEQDQQSDELRRRSFSRVLLPWSLLMLVAAVAAYVASAYVDTIVFNGEDVSKNITRTRLLFSLSSFFLFLALLDLHHSATQAKEVKVVAASILVLVAAIVQLVVTNKVHRSTGDLEDDLLRGSTSNATTAQGLRCFQECPVTLNQTSLGGGDGGGLRGCRKVCVYENSVCDGKVDLRSNLTFIGAHNATAFYTLDGARPLLFPDELYCSSRLLPGITTNYALSAVALVVSAALGSRAAAVGAFFWRRRRRRRQRRSRRRRKGTDADSATYGAMD